MTHREFIVVAKGGHETLLVRAPRPVTLAYARKNAWRWTKVVDEDSLEEDEYDGYLCDYRPMREEECVFVYPWDRGREVYLREHDNQRVCCYLPVMDVLSGIATGDNTPMKVANSFDTAWHEYELYARIFAQLRNEGYISFDYNEPKNGYHFN